MACDKNELWAFTFLWEIRQQSFWGAQIDCFKNVRSRQKICGLKISMINTKLAGNRMKLEDDAKIVGFTDIS